MKPARSIFRSRKRRALVVTDRPEAAYHTKIVESARQQIRPGTVREAIVWHAAKCRRPRGEPCTCTEANIDVEIVDPLRN